MEKNHCDLEKLLSDAQQKYFGQFDGGKAAADLLQLASSLVVSIIILSVKSLTFPESTCNLLNRRMGVRSITVLNLIG